MQFWNVGPSFLDRTEARTIPDEPPVWIAFSPAEKHGLVSRGMNDVLIPAIIARDSNVISLSRGIQFSILRNLASVDRLCCRVTEGTVEPEPPQRIVSPSLRVSSRELNSDLSKFLSANSGSWDSQWPLVRSISRVLVYKADHHYLIYRITKTNIARLFDITKTFILNVLCLPSPYKSRTVFCYVLVSVAE